MLEGDKKLSCFLECLGVKGKGNKHQGGIKNHQVKG